MEDKDKEVDNPFRFAVYFNDEYIGEADSFEIKKGENDKGIQIMPGLEIKGDFQAGKK